jgi:hypothetical protein
MASQAQTVDIQALNSMARAAIVGNSVKMEQVIRSVTVNPANEPVINLPPRYVGLLLGFVIEVEAEVENTGAATATRTPFGTANLVQEFRFDDLSNYTRVQVPGWYLALLNTIRQGYGFGGVYANNIPMGYGDNFNVYDGPSTIAAGATADLRQVFYLPISYSTTDLRGAIWASVVNATMNLQITLNQNIGTGNSVAAVYAGVNSLVEYTGNVKVNVYQVYLDQLPKDQNGRVILPPLDLNMVYDLKQTTYSGITANQDFPMSYSNFRQFLSTVAVFDNGNVFNSGSDVNYFSLAAANFTNIWRISPEYSALKTRGLIMSDMPPGTYLFSSRDIPINTINFGNMELNLNASTVNANARVLVGYESFGLVNQIVGATSLNVN